MEPPTQSPLGRVARHDRRDRWIIDLRPHGRIYSLGGVAFTGDEGRILADGVLAAIRLAVANGTPLEEAIAPYAGRARGKQIVAAFGRFVDHIDELVEAGDRSAKTAREYRRLLRAELPYWKKRTLDELDFAALEDWDRSLVARGLAPKSRRNYLGALRAACEWLVRRKEMKTVPPFPRVEVPEHMPTILPMEVVNFLIEKIAEDQRGPYLVAARMGLRPGEVRALDVSDIQRTEPVWKLRVSKAVQGPHSSSKIGPTKNRRDRLLPIHPDVREWLELHVDWTGRLRREPLFTNPVSHKRLSHSQFYDVWYRVRQGITDASLYQGTKHSFASDALESGIELDRIRKYLGHSDPRSTEKYAKLSDRSLDVFAER